MDRDLDDLSRARAGLVMAALLLGWRLKKRPPVSEPEASAPGQ
ncbi:Transporter, putative [Klebsiella pneumoniae IS46]|nr:Transporter, putative [Klebsiella pneumoniae IS22]CDL13579.1 Transporter, putative [Klebsiella pneumoniae IS46]